MWLLDSTDLDRHQGRADSILEAKSTMESVFMGESWSFISGEGGDFLNLGRKGDYQTRQRKTKVGRISRDLKLVVFSPYWMC